MPCLPDYRVLFIDAYDSFSNNIISLLETRLAGVHVVSVKIDQPIPDLPTFLRHFDAVVAGPGPGHPGKAADVGLISQLWQLGDEDMIPVLGICLGFQSLVTAFGGSVVPLPAPRHGIVRNVISNNASIFKDIARVFPVQYHSLHALLPSGAGLNGLNSLLDRVGLRNPSHHLEPLACDVHVDNTSSDQIQTHNANPDIILMAVKHKTKPFYGIQFHPESICSDEPSQKVIENWWSEVRQWSSQHKLWVPNSRDVEGRLHSSKSASFSMDLEALTELSLQGVDDWTASDGTTETNALTGPCPSPKTSLQVRSRVAPLNSMTVDQVSDLLGVSHGEAVVLDSEPHQRHDIGTTTIIGKVYDDSLRMEYFVGSGKVNVIQNWCTSIVDLADYDNNVFCYLKAFMNNHKAVGGDPNIPFWGGLVGNINYEACLETIDIRTPSREYKPDINFVFIERSVVIDHQSQQIYVQSITCDDDDWVKRISCRLAEITATTSAVRSYAPYMHQVGGLITCPKSSSYKSKIRKCQDFIRRGDSYELCLTNQATISKARRPSISWPMYLQLRSLNAAPFSAYLRLGGLTLLSSSPERFMRWTRPNTYTTNLVEETRSIVQFRPIKGTVKRYPEGPEEPAITLDQATALLSTPKERAENLMIVDLIRHDLHGVVGSGNVCVPKLMVVEEYTTLYQLVTVVEGTLINQNLGLSNAPSLTTSSQSSPSTSRPITPSSSDGCEPFGRLPLRSSSSKSTMAKNGIDVLAASLPPGSMTGAPKRRSCTLLRQIEDEQPRGVYSGVVGYMDVGGAGDFSVVIRSAFRWDQDISFDEERKEKNDVWTVGAGGAVTSLSTETGEWEEMMAKLGSTLRLFETGDAERA
ncbi:MAG: hypothetical protein Q9181_005203 [Wetmoreana brouardii]